MVSSAKAFLGRYLSGPLSGENPQKLIDFAVDQEKNTVSIISTGASAIGKLLILAVLLAAFITGMAGVVYMSLSGEEVKVPEITGKDFHESEKELAALGLKIKKRADRVGGDKINTVLEQLPKAGETVKTGQMILVVVSKAAMPGEETPRSVLKDLQTDDTEKIEEMISDKPKRARSNSNSNTKKKTDATRDVLGNANTSTKTATDDNKPADDKNDGGKSNKSDKPAAGDKPKDTPAAAKPKETPAKKP